MVISPPIKSQVKSPLIRAGEPLAAEAFQQIRRRLMLDCCKWDPQVGDVSTLCPFPLLIGTEQWAQLQHLAGRLARELMEAEKELLERPDLHRRLGLPRGIRSVLRNPTRLAPTPAAVRVLRFDFHWTPDGWKISEVNSDVPGGFSEASEFATLIAAHYPQTQTAGNPGAAWADAMAAVADGPIALLAAAGFMEDQQVVAYLARRLNERGISTHLTLPENLSWIDEYAYLYHDVKLGGIVRFFQAEWLKARRCVGLFVGGKTPVSNPGFAVLTESKRFPLVWDELSAPLPTWRELLPATVDPRDADWRHDESWLVKSALCNTGDTVLIRSLMNDRQWSRATRSVRWWPGGWVAQKRFEICPVESPSGPVFPCIGVYTVNGQPVGIYGRINHRPLIDFAAIDVAVLITDEQ